MEELRRQANALPSGQVAFATGYIPQDEVARFFDASSAVVLPYTEFSSQSGVLHDALAYGVPVVATAVGALAETVTSLGIGEVAPANDPAGLRHAIERLHTVNRYSEALRAVRRARQECSWKAAAEETLYAYADCI
jgi:glycosyltransferase involved in cell wall biosynthesis